MSGGNIEKKKEFSNLASKKDSSFKKKNALHRGGWGGLRNGKGVGNNPKDGPLQEGSVP